MEGVGAGSRYARLDALRAIAAVMVLGHHVVAAGTWDMAPASAAFFDGYRAVLVFFVLSGFLVFRPFAAGHVDPAAHVIKRVMRIMPAYVVALVGVSILSGDRTFIDHPVEHLLLIQNYDPALFRVFLPVSWTLVLEMTFYLALPLFAIAYSHLAVGYRGAVVLGCVALASLAAHILWAGGDDERQAQMLSLSFPAMIWAFVPGMLLALSMVAWPASIDRLCAPRWIGTAGILIVIGWFGRESAVTEMALVTGVALLIPWLLRPRTTPERTLVRQAATFGVVVSYPFYLWHVAILQATGRAGLTGPGAFAITFIVTAAIGVLSYRLIEAPAIGLSRIVVAKVRRAGGAPAPDPAGDPRGAGGDLTLDACPHLVPDVMA